MAIDELPTQEELLETIGEVMADLSAIHRKIDPLVNLYDKMEDEELDGEEELKRTLQTMNFVWWDVMRVIGKLRTAQRRLRDKGGSLADVEKER